MTANAATRINAAQRRVPISATANISSSNIERRMTACSTCNLRELCVPCCGLTCSEKAFADRLAFNRLHVRRGENLCRSGDRFTSLYAVRSGFFKSSALREDGCDQVLRFSMTGDILGMDGIGPEQHTCDTIALEDSDVCAIPFSKLQKLAHEIPGLQRQFHRTMSREIVRERGVMLLLGSMNANERIAMFLLNLSQRFAAIGYSRSEFVLRMTREEIGSYLGLKLETVSRIFSKFQQKGMIGVQLKNIRILDSAGLERVMDSARD